MTHVEDVSDTKTPHRLLLTLELREPSVSNLEEFIPIKKLISLRWRHNELDCVSDHQPHDCLLNSLFGRRSKKTSKLRVTGLCAGNSPGTGEFPAQKGSNAENVSIWWRHHVGSLPTVMKHTTAAPQVKIELTVLILLLFQTKNHR